MNGSVRERRGAREEGVHCEQGSSQLSCDSDSNDSLLLWHDKIRIHGGELLRSVDDLRQSHREVAAQHALAMVVLSVRPLRGARVGVAPGRVPVVAKVNPRAVRRAANPDIRNQRRILQTGAKDNVPIAEGASVESEDRSVPHRVSVVKRCAHNEVRNGEGGEKETA